jgi:hypothetical protein
MIFGGSPQAGRVMAPGWLSSDLVLVVLRPGSMKIRPNIYWICRLSMDTTRIHW